jgi:hypothetical protein
MAYCASGVFGMAFDDLGDACSRLQATQGFVAQYVSAGAFIERFEISSCQC